MVDRSGSGPRDVSHRINAERLMLLAWARAILLQLAHPLIAAGVADHSGFRGSTGAALARLHDTVSAMLAITFGDDTARERTLETIRSIHRRVHGTLVESCGRFDRGSPYSAEDPALLLWVHATLIESTVVVYERLIAPLTAAERDEYCAASAAVALALGARPDDVPRSWGSLRRYIDDMHGSGRLSIGSQARVLVAALMAPLPGRVAARSVTPLLRLLAAGQLPADIRRQSGFAWSDRRQWWFEKAMTLLRRSRRLTPAALAIWKAAR